MPKSSAPPETDSASDGDPKSHFTKAMEEAKAGAQALGKEAADKAGEYREKLNQSGDEFAEQARTKSDEAKDKAYDLANEGKDKASKAMSDLGKLVEEQGDAVDDAVGDKYGEYVRTAGKSIQDTAAKLDEKSFEDMGDDAKEFVRKSPALAVGMAAAAGFLLARLFKRN
ncbi:MAG: hypothetical protein P8J20_13080 [Novosphingobium sp.]|nr:hypothetical protein [Novosphingobium sp.]